MRGKVAVAIVDGEIVKMPIDEDAYEFLRLRAYGWGMPIVNLYIPIFKKARERGITRLSRNFVEQCLNEIKEI